MMKYILFLVLSFIASLAFAQEGYRDSIRSHRENYIAKHGVVKGEDKKNLQFYEVNEDLKLMARVQLVENSPWFKMQTSGLMQPLYRVYGIAEFQINGEKQALHIYQSQSLMNTPQYNNYLFIPFTDSTSGKTSYAGGRYLDLRTEDITGGLLVIDFNKAYNPYCAYVSGKYNCPIPPRENHLQVAIIAGEKDYKN